MLYKSSKGEVEISTMPLSHAKNALNKLLRTEPERGEEIEALDKHVKAMEVEATAKALAGDENTPKIGDNNPPPDDPPPAAPALKGRKAIETHVADLIDQAKTCPLTIADENQAGHVARLHRDLQAAVTLVKDNATAEKKPHNDAVAEIQKWQNGFVASGLKGTPDGSLTKALLATSNLSSAWLVKLDNERKDREAEAAAAAVVAAQEAVVAREEAKTSTDVEVIDRAEDALAAAQALIKQAVGVSKEKAQAGGGDGYRALGLRSTYTAHLIDAPDSWALAYGHYKQIPEFMAEFHALIQRWADKDAKIEANRVRGVPGFNFIEEKVAA